MADENPKLRSAQLLRKIHKQICFERGEHEDEVSTLYSDGADAIEQVNQGPKVKLLVWDWIYESGIIAQAKCPFGYYTVLEDEDSASRVFLERHTEAYNYCEFGSVEISSGYGEPEDFLNVAQLDYENRIRNALEGQS